MGNKASAQSFPADAVVAQTVATVNTFGPIFLKAYNVAVVRKLRKIKLQPPSAPQLPMCARQLPPLRPPLQRNLSLRIMMQRPMLR